MDIDRRAREAASEIVEGERFEQFRVDAQDFLSARELGEAVSTRIEGRSAALVDAAEIVNRSFPERDQVGHFTNVISPVVMPNRRFSLWPPLIGLIALFGLVVSLVVTGLSGGGLGAALFRPHFWLLLLAFAIFGWWRRSVVMVPDGCQALITRFGKLEGKQRIDTLLMEIERAKKERDARLIEVKAARNKARQDVARMLEEQETEAQRVRLEIETRGRTTLVQAENEATALRHLGQAHRDNRAVLQYELARPRVEVGEQLLRHAPRPVLVQGDDGEPSALSTLVLAQLLPQLAADGSTQKILPGRNREDQRPSSAQTEAT